MMIKNAKFTFVWDGGYEVTTDCKVDMKTREVLIMDKTYQIKSVYGHCEAYDKYGKFMASGDTYEECEQDLINVIFSEARGDLIA